MTEKVIELRMAAKMLPFMQKHKRIKIAVGGRGGQKTTAVSDAVAAKMSAGVRVGCGRELMNSIEDSVHSSIESSIERLGIPGFTVQANKIFHESGGHNFYKGLSRNPTAIKSINAVDIFWLEEAQDLSKSTLDKFFPSIRKAAGQENEPEIWCTLNRGSEKDPFAQRFLVPYEKQLARNGGYYEDDYLMIVEINWQDNPWFFESGLDIERRQDKERMSRAEYDHVWGGQYYDQVEDSIILPEWFDSCVDAHERLGFKPTGVEVVSHDPSDLGNDTKGLVYRHGSVVKDVLERDYGDVNDGFDWACEYAIEKKADLFTWDGDGLGLGLRRQAGDYFDDKKWIDWQMFRGGEAPMYPEAVYGGPDESLDKPRKNKDIFANQRAQFYYELADKMQRTHRAVTEKEYHNPDDMISFSSKIELLSSLRAELCRIPRKKRPNANGKRQIMSKPEMKAEGIDSPNLADPVMMSYKIPVPKQAFIPQPAPLRPAFG